LIRLLSYHTGEQVEVGKPLAGDSRPVEEGRLHTVGDNRSVEGILLVVGDSRSVEEGRLHTVGDNRSVEGILLVVGDNCPAE
jgi:hypothetical protein